MFLITLNWLTLLKAVVSNALSQAVCYGKAHSKHTPVPVPIGLLWCQEIKSL